MAQPSKGSSSGSRWSWGSFFLIICGIFIGGFLYRWWQSDSGSSVDHRVIQGGSSQVERSATIPSPTPQPTVRHSVGVDLTAGIGLWHQKSAGGADRQSSLIFVGSSYGKDSIEINLTGEWSLPIQIAGGQRFEIASSDLFYDILPTGFYEDQAIRGISNPVGAEEPIDFGELFDVSRSFRVRATVYPDGAVHGGTIVILTEPVVR